LRLQHDRSQSVRSAAVDRFGRSDIPMHRLRSPFLIGISFRLVPPWRIHVSDRLARPCRSELVGLCLRAQTKKSNINADVIFVMF
jgi:hypothetical protein